jgi:uncharacterized protein (DUF924 family)
MRWVEDVLAFWFEATRPEQWFAADPAFDEEVRRRFLSLHETLAAQPRDTLLRDARTALAAIIVFDQMSRNMFRGTARAFAVDPKALDIAGVMVAGGFDRGLTKEERLFCYLPFEHAEDSAAQARGTELILGLGDPELTKWAEAHKAIIDRFGRFPHRNAALARPSTPQEIEFLKAPGSSF